MTLWGASFSNNEDLKSRFDRFDEDFMEIHEICHEEERKSFIEYLQTEYSQDDPFAEQLPLNLEQLIHPYQSIVVLYGNDSSYGAINFELFEMSQSDIPFEAKAALLASIVYEAK
ncbi:hypothetical protein [Paenibacillus sp. NEAU-GSW1]|uniref:hypothetical protein n=1 Tax=Paenibacillus sp. NEAU-GSW1 TaxID=2682486 RepID=UPI001C129A4E|nr:hypothetical protein [Paenibacillus sp. NEAU-GSW1]